MNLMHTEVQNVMKEQKRKTQKIALITNGEGELCSEENEVREVWMQDISKLYGGSKRTRFKNSQWNNTKHVSDISM